MEYFIDESRPIFLQVSERIEEDILAGRLVEEEQVPSTNQFSALYQINPATAAKGVNMLVDQGILYKKRGVGMFVASGSRARVIAKRREHFYEQYIISMMQEAQKLGIDTEQLIEMIQKGAKTV